MAHNSVQRTAPIPIAPKPPRREPTPQRQDNLHKFEIGPSSVQTGASVESSPVAGSTLALCQTCRFPGTKCVLSDDEDGYSACHGNGSECSFLSNSLASPQSRKRKMNGVPFPEANISKRSSPITTTRKLGHSGLSSTTASSSFLEDLANVGGPAMLRRTLGMQNDRFSQYIGLTTDFEPSLINLSTFDPQDESLLTRGILRKVSDEDTFLMLPDSSTPGHDHVMEDLDAIEAVVSPNGPQLMDLYFRIVHPAFPIIQKHVFLEKYERSHRELSPQLSPPILAAVPIENFHRPYWQQYIF
ncbi:transcription factor TamA [Metarhizium rileyi]|uniref:Transcription factor TamA n=1 Tax=Metarhizium rileyi (strain RCEF 4871) TaxID=1649241 RepID=A0A162M6K7_METRR|nr:transcription factor TamA [Metarhizium rileyi RCEF 4871]